MCSEVSPVEVHTVVVERVQQHITRLDELTRVVRRHPAVPDEDLVPGVNVDLAGTGPALEDPGVRVVDLASPVADTVEAEYRVRLGAQPAGRSWSRNTPPGNCARSAATTSGRGGPKIWFAYQVTTSDGTRKSLHGQSGPDSIGRTLVGRRVSQILECTAIDRTLSGA